MPFAPESQLCDEDLEWSFNDVLWENVSEEAKDLILKLLEKDADKRWTASKCLGHPWILKAPDGFAACRSLKTTTENLKQFNARKKFKTAVRTAVILNRMGRTPQQKGLLPESNSTENPDSSGVRPAEASISEEAVR